MTEIEQLPQNGIDLSAAEDEESSKARPADIEQDMREMERRKRVEAIMGSKLFREELERIVDCARDNGNADGILQQLSDIVGVPSSRIGSVFKTSNCMLPINDIRGVESMGYAKGEKILRCKLAATFRLLDLYGWTQGLGAQITARLKVDQEYFLVNPYGLLHHEITASSLNKVDMQGCIVEQGTTNFGVNKSHFVLHSVVHAARPDIRCAIYIGCTPVVAISSLKTGLLPLTKDACVLGELSTYSYLGYLNDEEERNKLVRNLGPNSKVILLNNHGALCCGETIEEAYFAACHIVQACETQLQLLPVGLDNLVLIPEESRKIIYDQSRRPPEDLEKKFAAATLAESNKSEEEKNAGVDNATKVIGQSPKWRVGGAEFEALMRMLDNAGYRTGYIYRHPLIKSDPPKPKNDVELPPAVSSLGYLLEEEELFRQGIWKKGDMRKGGDRSRWLNSPNVYQKVEVLETGTPDPKKITKWVAEGSPTHSTPVRIEDPLQFVPVNTNPKEFKRVQQQIKDNRRADKISAGPQSHILEGVTWDEANRIKDATVSSAGDHVVLMGAASKGIIQRGFQHNATVYKAPYAKNPFDNVTDDELNEYKRTVERKKKSIHGEYTDTDFSESEALSSLQTSGAQLQTKQTTTTTTTTTAAVSQSEPEDISEHQVMRIQTEQAPVPSQPEVVLSDDAPFLLKNYQDPKIHQPFPLMCHSSSINEHQSNPECGEAGKEKEGETYFTDNQKNNYNMHDLTNLNVKLIKQLEQNVLFQNQKEKLFHTYSHTYTYTHEHACEDPGNGNLSNFSMYDSPYQQLSKDEHKLCDSSLPSGSAHIDRSMRCGKNLCSKDKYLKLLKTKFAICSSPTICDKIFESILKPENLTNQSPIKENQFLTSNTPLYRCAANNKKNLSAKSNSPYRTVSHFGFNKPMREPKPNHKHRATKTEREQKYVPLKRSVSYEEIFSSPRYLNLCECCFELIVRLKPELMKYKTKLHNVEEKYITGDDGDLSEKDNPILELSEPCCSTLALHLNKIEDEGISKEDSLESTMTYSTFNEKITRMNYSELSSAPQTHNSPNDICELEDYFIKSTNFSTKNSNDDSMDFTYYDNDTSSQISLTEDSKQISESFKNKVKIKNLEKNSKKLMSRDERSRRKLEFQELWEDNVNFAEHFENEILAYNNVEPKNPIIQNIVEANKEVLNEQSSVNSLTNKDIEEFKSTLSRVSFRSSASNHVDELEINKMKCFKILANECHQLESETDSSHAFHTTDNQIGGPLRDSENAFGLGCSKSNENTDKFSILERTILEKIHDNDLNKSEQIFEKIENTIRNKITPFQLELKIKEQAILLQDEKNYNDKENILSKSFDLSNTNLTNESLQARRSRSLSSFKKNSFSPAPIKVNKASSHLTGLQKNTTGTKSPCLQKSIVKKDKKCRNFILENIRNASVPRQSPQNKRSQCNVVHQIEEKHIFTSSRILKCKKSTYKTLERNPNIISPRKSPSSAVYSFQSKLVRGSPRFWISMSQSHSTKKGPQPSSSANIRNVTTSTEKRNPSPINTCSLAVTDPIETQISNNVDAEIDALGDEIQQIQPRLENYKRKLDDFGHRVADCVNNINECVTTQENIISVQKKLKDCMKVQEYTEEIMCRVHTFSLSETED